ncbi:hypothetical protein VNO77_09200 [Canavalia gladiata]|uniref:Late embryogenesis abundant protein LEA-2 subgroup domain-containing protein n=1 Tax=Canavalia gladiata TaxID=3824 RepID=A0AAN9M9T8_CANGL
MCNSRIILYLICFIFIICPLSFLISAIVTGFKPNKYSEFVVTNATLTQFTYTNNTLQYNLTLNIEGPLNTYRNNVKALAMYQNVSFGFTTLPIPCTNELTLMFNGQQMMSLGADQISELNKEKRIEVYHINIKLCLMRKRTSCKTKKKTKPVVYCDLHVPLSSNNGTPPVLQFRNSLCDLLYVNDNCSLRQ